MNACLTSIYPQLHPVAVATFISNSLIAVYGLYLFGSFVSLTRRHILNAILSMGMVATGLAIKELFHMSYAGYPRTSICIEFVATIDSTIPSIHAAVAFWLTFHAVGYMFSFLEQEDMSLLNAPSIAKWKAYLLLVMISLYFATVCATRLYLNVNIHMDIVAGLVLTCIFLAIEWQLHNYLDAEPEEQKAE